MESVSLRELTVDEIDLVGGGNETAWGISTGVATAMVIGAAAISSPFLAAGFAGGSLIASGFAIYYLLAD